jgi:pimeloyl-ACP methyl ester carboxylesterase
VTPFLAGVCFAGAGFLAADALRRRRRRLDHRLIRAPRDAHIPPTVVVPGIMGSGLLRADGTRVWLNLGNAMGQHRLDLPFKLPLRDATDDLRPGSLLGIDHFMPRLFGFTEYYDLLELLEGAGFRPSAKTAGEGLIHHVFSYDWRRDLVESAGRLEETLDALAEVRGEPDLRVNLVGHSMGGLVARYYLRYGSAEPREGAPVTWAGARRIRNLILVATPNAGGIHALEAMLYGARVGLSYTTLASSVVSRMPSVYQLMPPRGAPALLDHQAQPLDLDLHDVETWKRLGWGPYGPAPMRRLMGGADPAHVKEYETFLPEVLGRAAAFHRALSVEPDTPSPVKVVVLGGDCMPTVARCLVPERPGMPPRFEPVTRAEADGMSEAGDGRVTRASVLGSHLPRAEASETGSGYPEVAQAFFGAADHHGIYHEPTFQSILLRLLLRPAGTPPGALPVGEPTPALAECPPDGARRVTDGLPQTWLG